MKQSGAEFLRSIRLRGRGPARLLAHIAKHAGFAVRRVAELGVYKGAGIAKLLQFLPDLEQLVGVDVWGTLCKHGPMQRTNDEASWEAMYQGLVAKYATDPRVELVRAYTAPTAAHYPDGYFDAVFIDAGHTYADVAADIRAWLPKVRPGGLLFGHDYYGRAGNNGVAPAVHDALGASNIVAGSYRVWCYLVPGVLPEVAPAMYSENFFSKRRRRFRSRQRAVAEIILLALGLDRDPGSCYDMGCACGYYLERLKELGWKVNGSDAHRDAARRFISRPVRRSVVQADAGEPLAVADRYGLVLCMDVAEHVAPDRAPVLARNLVALTKPGNQIVLCAGTPGMRGTGHVNNQPPEYWDGLMRWAGAETDPNATDALREKLGAISDPLTQADRIAVYRVR